MYKAPEFPLREDPDPMNTAPLLPELAVPVLRTTKPLIPRAPALAVDRTISPLEVPEL
jgi:hypothetical protein